MMRNSKVTYDSSGLCFNCDEVQIHDSKTKQWVQVEGVASCKTLDDVSQILNSTWCVYLGFEIYTVHDALTLRLFRKFLKLTAKNTTKIGFKAPAWHCSWYS